MAAIAGPVARTLKDSAIQAAASIVYDGNLHQSLWLPETSSHGRLRVTFSTTSNFSNETLPALLFCGPMFGSRWMVLDMNHLAAKNGVRVICTDRPGMGGSTRVQLNLRMQVWLETVPVLLKRLEVEHVSLLCHSTGAMYAMNTMYHLRNVLDPKTPYVAFIAPWVNYKNPHTTLMNVVSKIPNGLLDYWSSIAKFTQQSVVPVMSWSGGIVSSMDPTTSESSTLADKYGVPADAAKEIERLKMMYFFEEDTTGANEEARLCMRKEGSGNWGICEDYDDFVRSLVKLEQASMKTQPGSPLLKVQVYFAASDVMIGKDGQKLFEQSWQQEGVKESIVFESKTLEGTTHDSIVLDPKQGAWNVIFKRAKSVSVQR